MKKLLAMILMVGMMLLASVFAYAEEAKAAYQTPAEIVAALTDRTVEGVLAERAESGKTYGTIANDAGKLAEFKAESLALKKDILAEQVAKGNLTQEEATSLIAAMEAKQAACDGTGAGRGGCGLARGAGKGQGKGRGMGIGGGRILGGQRLQDGSCERGN